MNDYINNKKLMDFLFNKQKIDFKYPYFRFIILDFNNKHKLLDDILLIFEEATNLIGTITIEDKIVVLHHDEIEDLDELLNSIKYDFLVEFKSFQSCKLNVNQVNEFHLLFNLYLKYLSNKDNLFYRISDLILSIVSKNTILSNTSKTVLTTGNDRALDLRELRRLILDKLAFDTQIENLILAMFDNNLNVSKAANKTYMHRNTANYKLDIIKKETGLNIQNFKDAMSMHLLIKE